MGRPHKKIRQKKQKKNKISSPSVFPDTRGRGPFPSARIGHSGKRLPSPSAREDTQGRIFVFFVFFCLIFCEAFPHYLKLPVQIWDNFDFFCYISLVFFVSLNFFAYFEFELQVHEIMEFGDSKNYINDIWCMLRPYPGTRMKCRASC